MISVPYKKFEGNVLLPFAPLALKSSSGMPTYLDAFVDSGADYSIFHADLMTILKLNPRQAKIKKVQVGDGDYIKTYPFLIDVEFFGETFKAPINFSKELGPGFNLLGRAGFFNRFRFCFDDKHHVLILTRL